MIDYTKHRPHPTKWRGTQFRSRLEAKWACFFGLVGIPWHYEPFDLSGWSPDFLIETPNGPWLVEVKPVRGPDIPTLEKMSASTPWEEYPRAVLVGLGVFKKMNGLHYHQWGWDLQAPGLNRLNFDTVTDIHLPAPARGRLGDIWSEASNSVQWRPGR